MFNKIIINIFLLLFCAMALAQQPEQKYLQIVDSLTAKQKADRNAVVLRSEVDSLIKLYNDKQIKLQIPVQQPLQEMKDSYSSIILIGVLLIFTLLIAMLYLFYRHQQKVYRMVGVINKNPRPLSNLKVSADKNDKGKISKESLEDTITELNAELLKLSKENEGLEGVIKEYNGIQHEYESLKHGIQKTYKIKNYPGYDKAKEDNLAMQRVFDTEGSVAHYAYENFLKPVLAIADNNKNNPAKISDEDTEKVLELLISLSLLYIEYLYLRVNDLAIGGKMVQRIHSFEKGNGIDLSLLKKLNTESGNRALVLRMILDKADLHQLTYPVFDETNLNQL